MSETREEQIARLRGWLNVRSVLEHEIAASLGSEITETRYTKALAAALHAFEVMPELLEACKEAAIELALQQVADEQWGTAEVQRKLEAAIAKAEGK